MTDYLQSNFKQMESFRPEFYALLKKKYEKLTIDEDRIINGMSRDGNPVLTIIDKEGKEVRLNSAYRPMQEAEKWADQYSFRNISTTIIMFGIGNGIFVRKMLERSDEDTSVYLYEPDIQVFFNQLSVQDMTDIISDERVRIYLKGIDDEDFEDEMLASHTWSEVASQIFCWHPGYENLYRIEFDEFQVKVQRVNGMLKVNADTTAFLSKIAIHNVFRNLHFIKNSNYVTELIGEIPEDVPAIIVSAGPSLDDNIEELKKAVGKAFILATDTSVKYLLAHDVPFDAVITLDAQKSPAHLMNEKCQNIPLFCVMEARNEIMEYHTGRKIWFRSGFYIENLYEKFGHIFPGYHPGGSVATGAFSLCVSLMFKTIILIGSDFAYKGESTHAGEVVSNIINEEYTTEWIEGINGEKVKSRYDWIIYRDWFEQSIRNMKDIEVIDATEGGALIKGTKIMTLAEAIDQYCGQVFSFEDLLEKIPYTFDENMYKKVQEECLSLRYEFFTMRQNLKKAINAGQGYLSLIQSKVENPKKINRYLKEIKNANVAMKRLELDELLETYVADKTNDLMEKINILSEDADQNLIDTLELSNALYEEMLNGVEELEPIAMESLEKM